MKPLLIITGASRGIGFASAQLFLSQNYDVINISRTPCSLLNVTNIAADLSQSNWLSDVKNVLAKCCVTPRVIALVHNAAIYRSNTVSNIDEKVLQQDLQINVIAPMLLNTAVIPHMTKGSGIVYIGSTLSLKAVPNYASYVVSKHAVIGLNAATTQDCFGKGIHSVCVCPGITDTEMLRNEVNNDPARLAELATMMSENRLVTPQEIAECIYFAATHSALNGAVLHASLGQKEL